VSTTLNSNATGAMQDEIVESNGSTQEVDKYIEQCRSLCSDPLISEKTRDMYEGMFDELKEGGEVDKARENVGFLIQMLNEARGYKLDFESKLDDYVRQGFISEESKTKSVEWFYDPDTPEFYRKQWIKDKFPNYLKERKELASKRKGLAEDIDKIGVDNIQNSKLRKEIEFLKDNKEWFGTLGFTQRKNLIDRIKAGLAIEGKSDVYKVLFKKAEKVLLDATQKPHPALHRDKVGRWLKKIFESNANPKQIDAFITGNGHSGGKSLPELIEVWRKVAIEFWTLREDSAFNGTKKTFINTKEFLHKHYDDRVSYINLMKTQRDRAKVLRSQAMSRVFMPNKIEWIDKHLFDGSHTLTDLESIINGDLAQYLNPIEDYMDGKEFEEEEDSGIEVGQSDAKQIDAIIESLPVGLQSMMVALCELGSDCVKMAGWASYNREWSRKNGYLTDEREEEAIRVGKMQAKMRMRKEKKRGVVNETIQGETGEAEYIELSRTSATNVCLDTNDTGARSAFVETVRRTKNDGRAWYWTNLILHSNGNLMSSEDQKNFTSKTYKMRNLLRSLESKGKRYEFSSTAVDLSHKAQEYKKPTKSERSANYSGSKA
jgi:hypothetical protein